MTMQYPDEPTTNEHGERAVWALEHWEAEVLYRPAVNIYRKGLDEKWRAIYREATCGDEIPYMTHDELVASGRYTILKATKDG